MDEGQLDSRKERIPRSLFCADCAAHALWRREHSDIWIWYENKTGKISFYAMRNEWMGGEDDFTDFDDSTDRNHRSLRSSCPPSNCQTQRSRTKEEEKPFDYNFLPFNFQYEYLKISFCSFFLFSPLRLLLWPFLRLFWFALIKDGRYESGGGGKCFSIRIFSCLIEMKWRLEHGMAICGKFQYRFRR